MRLIFTLLLATACQAEHLEYDSARRVPFANDPAYTRSEYHWFVKNTGQPSALYLNNVFQSNESGTNDIRILEAWNVQSNSTLTVGLVDQPNLHGAQMEATLRLVSRGEVTNANLARLFPDFLAMGISNFVAQGLKAIVVPAGGAGIQELSNACSYAYAQGAMLICSVPNAFQNIDSTPDYPSSWAHLLPNIIPTSMTDRNGAHYSVAAYGTNVLDAPGRNIVCQMPTATNYISGTSQSAAVMGGVVALLVSRYPGQSPEAYREALRASVYEGRRIDALRALELPRPTTIATSAGAMAMGLQHWTYVLEQSHELGDWFLATNYTDGFYRARTPVSAQQLLMLAESQSEPALRISAPPQFKMQKRTIDTRIMIPKIPENKSFNRKAVGGN